MRAGRTPLRRLTRPQLDNTLRDLVGATGNPASVIAADEHIGPFTSNALVPITDLVVVQHSELAAKAAADAVARMNTIAGCDLAAATTNTCVTSFVETFGRKAYRRPLATDERDQYVTLYTTEKAAGTAATAFQQVVETMLQSPFFVYHVDVGAGAPSGTPVRLTSYELASRLSYFLWNTMPDEALFARAAANTLQDDAVLAAEVERMLADARAADAIPSFHLQWLGLDSLESTEKDAALFPQWNATMASAMRAETAAFTDHVVRRGDGLMSTLLTASFSFPQGALFQLYGVAQPAGFRAGDMVTLDSSQRGGILTQGAFLAAHAHRDQTSPVHRGIFVRENILCQTLQPPPADVNTTPPPPSTAATTRQRFANHESDARCASLPPVHRPHRPGVRELRFGRRLPDAGRRRQRSTSPARWSAAGATWPASSTARSSWAASWPPAPTSPTASPTSGSASRSGAWKRPKTPAPCRRCTRRSPPRGATFAS